MLNNSFSAKTANFISFPNSQNYSNSEAVTTSTDMGEVKKSKYYEYSTKNSVIIVITNLDFPFFIQARIICIGASSIKFLLYR